jgi:hypothetical protein
MTPQYVAPQFPFICRSKGAMLFNTREQQDDVRISDSDPVQPIKNYRDNGRLAMARIDFGSLPHGNPCAQCGKPIAAPEWVETEPHRASYLWHCHACNYRFEAIAYFAESDQQAIAA